MNSDLLHCKQILYHLSHHRSLGRVRSHITKIEEHPGPFTLQTRDLSSWRGLPSMVERAWSLPLTDIPREEHGWSLAGSDRPREPCGCEKAEASFPLPACPLRTLPATTQLMKCSWKTVMATEEAASCQVTRRPWASVLRVTIPVLLSIGTCYLICTLCFRQQQQLDSTRVSLKGRMREGGDRRMLPGDLRVGTGPWGGGRGAASGEKAEGC